MKRHPLIVRLPPEIHEEIKRRAAKMADEVGLPVSLNSYIVKVLTEHIKGRR